MLTRFALFVFAVFICMAPVAADEIKAATWAEALERIPCEQVKKDDAGSWSVTGPVEIQGRHFDNHALTEREEIAVLERRCPPKRNCGGGVLLRGAGC